MYKKQIGHILMVGLKYFFDFDYTLCSHALLVGLLILGFFRLILSQVAATFYNGVATVKDDAKTIKNELLAVKTRWENSSTREVIITIYLSMKELAGTRYQ